MVMSERKGLRHVHDERTNRVQSVSHGKHWERRECIIGHCYDA